MPRDYKPDLIENIHHSVLYRHTKKGSLKPQDDQTVLDQYDFKFLVKNYLDERGKRGGEIIYLEESQPQDSLCENASLDERGKRGGEIIYLEESQPQDSLCENAKPL
ncbi:hypothetical protein QE152_g29921 [Popillia japonica]|uniref:Uncharacterized protein n=1 Tax=Popillia japonica TaxID=7064 RepID=A0AAW1JG69_POPJA